MQLRPLLWLLCGLCFAAGHFSYAAPPMLLRDKRLECEFTLSPNQLGSVQVFAGHIRLQTELDMFVRIQRPRWPLRPKKWFFLVHGLLDSHRGYDEITRLLLTEGYGVVRMDVRGFARSMPDKIPVRIPYTEHVEDLKALLLHLREEFGIERPRLVGHSMGGGLALALLEDPEGSELVDDRAVVVAPYVYRLEYYAAEKLAYGGFSLPNPLFAIEKMLPKIVTLGPEYIVDTLVGEPQMRAIFAEFFEANSGKRDFSNETQKESVKSKLVQCAVATVKGLRDFHAIHATVQIPKNIQIDLAYGTDDELVERQLARKLGAALTQRDGSVYELKAGHMILEEKPHELVEILLKDKDVASRQEKK